MRIAVITDIHGNAAALDAMLEDAAARDGRNLRDAGAVARLLVAGITGAHIQESGGFPGGEGLETFAQRVVDVIVWGWGAW